ncbi:hypothetical protein PMAYCL1PPCAC_25184, partial [Pristionchus mayeri]
MDHSSMGHGVAAMDMGHGDSGQVMWQWFHTELNDTVIFSWWKVTDLPSLLVSCLLVAAAGFVLEWLRTVRTRLKDGSGSGLIAARHGTMHGGDTVGYGTFSDGSQTESDLTSFVHVRDTALFGVQTVLSYTIMLVFMTFSVQLCTSLVVGTALGYWVFGRQR